MDPAYLNKTIVDLSDPELMALAFMGPNADPYVKHIVEQVKANPINLGSVTCCTVDCLLHEDEVRAYTQNSTDWRPDFPVNFPQHKTETSFSDDDWYTIKPPNLVSKYEMNSYYKGISGDPPKLMYRSDLNTNPYPTRPPGARFFSVPEKTAHGVFNTPLNAVWDTVAPQILASIKARGLQYSALKTVRFSIVHDGRPKVTTLSPVVVWIAVRPDTTNAVAVCDATPDILNILAAHHITDVVVEWYEGAVTRLVGPPLMKVENIFSGKFGYNHPFNTGLGIPIARASDGGEGTLTFLFKEMKTSSGEPSDRILGVTNKHVVSTDIMSDYEFDEANPQQILVCSDRRLGRAVAEIKYAIATVLREAVGLVEELTASRKVALDHKIEANINLQALLAEVSADWSDSKSRRLGVVDWAPGISVSVDEYHYTRDLATVVVDKEKLENFESNTVDLGNRYDIAQMMILFWSASSNRILGLTERRGTPFETPFGNQLSIRTALSRQFIMNPDTLDENGEPLSVVAKYGNETKLTFGRYSGMDAYICTDTGLESREVFVYNYDWTSGNFASCGDSGSLVFTGEGSALAMLHSGMPRGKYSHVSFGTPIWWVIKQLLVQYPDAEFYGMTYTID